MDNYKKDIISYEERLEVIKQTDNLLKTYNYNTHLNELDFIFKKNKHFPQETNIIISNTSIDQSVLEIKLDTPTISSSIKCLPKKYKKLKELKESTKSKKSKKSKKITKLKELKELQSYMINLTYYEQYNDSQFLKNINKSLELLNKKK